MFSPRFSGLRPLFFSLLFASGCYARELSLFTSSVTYCEPPEAILIQYFDVAYIAHNNSVFFNISAESVQDNINVSANLMLNVYGMNPVNLTIDLCSILEGALCPLPKYHFKGSQTLQLPSSVDTSQVPAIAYYVPDLEAFAQLVLTDDESGDTKACVQATLANGWSMHQPAVSWATGAFTFLTLLLSIWQSSSPFAVLPFRLLDLFHMFQTIAASAFLSLNYPSAYQQFAVNFAWAMGFITSSGAQSSIDNMRALTGGALANSSSSSAIERVNRKLSPYNADGVSTADLSFLSEFTSPNVLANSIFGDGPYTPVLDPSSSTVQTVTDGGSNVLDAGVPIYVNTFNVATANAFMTIFFTLLVLTAIYLTAWLCAISFSYLQRRYSWQSKPLFRDFSSLYQPFLISWGVRLLLIVWFPIMVFTMFQWTLKDSWLSLLFSILTFLCIIAGIVLPCFRLFKASRQSSWKILHSDDSLLSKFSPLYAFFREERFFFGLAVVASYLFKAIVISAAKDHGAVQVALFLFTDVTMFILLLVLKVSTSRGGDFFLAFLALVRLVCTGLHLSFIQGLEVSPIPRVAIGLVSAVIYAVTILVIMGNIVMHVILWIRNGSAMQSISSVRGSPSTNSDDASEKGSSTLTGPSVGEAGGRPLNPTPDQNVLLDPSLIRTYPSMTPTTTVTGAPTASSASSTLGSLLPHRRSFSVSPPQSASARHSPILDSFSTPTSTSPTSPGHSDIHLHGSNTHSSNS